MITRYKQFESNIQDDTEPTKEYLDGVKRFINIRHRDSIDYNNEDVKEFILNCELDGWGESVCAFHIMQKFNKSNTDGSKYERYLKPRPEAK